MHTCHCQIADIVKVIVVTACWRFSLTDSLLASKADFPSPTLFIMGIPYSKEINAAFEQVTPLVAAGYEVLRTTKDIAILLACIQVLTVVLLFLILMALLGLLFSVNPDLVEERQQLVTPALQRLASSVLAFGGVAKVLLYAFLGAASVGYGMFLWQGYVTGTTLPASDEEESEDSPEQSDKDKKSAKDAKNAKEKKRSDKNEEK
ncbi:hypothetical protein HRR83_001182 [Exophiala dermatitidis]|nr:hypothetical protein HRR74_001186 [Exophiala dermatitidis]KAJ4527061.1 hypothetical protein HRR73_001858 [Exophiala dermatitidis]KAJ4532779.1 hypothetical protein HRR76_007760 [Exophiala dermatitidis]KAJ4546710.1 hypothetical protein HRR77_004254 [Exophiala dermatitidis]KAJ4573922.1 hypothetical protein HRR79_002931 [Exophiala dermatitidis]